MALSPEERELLDMQTELLQQAVAAGQAGQNLNALLTPILLEEAGYTVNRATEDVINPQFVSLKKEREKLRNQVRKNEQYFARGEDGKLRLSRAGRGSLDASKRKQLMELMNKVNSVEEKFRKTEQYTQRAGDILGLERLPEEADPAQNLREENEQLLLERQNAALRGELPVNPALLSSLDEQEEELRAQLMQNLGEGFETSTPGIEALSEFEQKKQAILEAARRDDIATAGGLANQMGSFMQGVTGNRFAQTGAILGSQFGGATNLAQISQSYTNPLSFLQSNRALDFQIAQANNSPGVFESLLTQGAGTAMTFGLGKIFGVYDDD